MKLELKSISLLDIKFLYEINSFPNSINLFKVIVSKLTLTHALRSINSTN